jgi:sugar phosphate isomerase/epimerase
MSTQHSNTYPKLHNAMWPGLVGKGSPGAEPCIDLDTMLDLTARAEVDGIKFDGVDLFLFEPHISIDADDDALKRLAEKIQSRGFVVGSVVAPVWPPTGGGSAMGNPEDRQKFVEQVRKGCRIAKRLRELGARPHGVVRIDSASGVADWTQDPDGNQAKIAETFKAACDVAEEYGERLAAEGEICWGGMHSWKKMLDLLQRIDRPRTLGFQADMAHTLLYTLGYNAPEDAILPADWDWSDPARLDDALATLTAALRPWTIDFHVAQNDATVHGSGTHDKTGHHCLPDDPNGKLTIPHHAGYWLRQAGQPTKAFQHICWDGCMFPNATMMEQGTWNKILASMIAVRDAHGWTLDEPQPAPTPKTPVQIESSTPPRAAARKPKKAKPSARRAAPSRRKAGKAATKKKPRTSKAPCPAKRTKLARAAGKVKRHNMVKKSKPAKRVKRPQRNKVLKKSKTGKAARKSRR